MKTSIRNYGLAIFALLALSSQLFAGASGPKKALIIGIGKYPAASGWKPINVDQDVIFIKKSLQIFGFNQGDINLLMDSAATYNGVIEALGQLYDKADYGDVVHIHLSGHGLQIFDANQDEEDKLDEVFVPFDGDYKSSENLLTDDELNVWIAKFRLKVGPEGQVVLSMDVSHSGPDEVILPTSSTQQLVTRGGFIEVTNGYKEDGKTAPFIAFATCLAHQISFETLTQEGKPVGLWSYAFYEATKKLSAKAEEISILTFSMLQESVVEIIQKTQPSQTPVCVGDVQSFCYQPKPTTSIPSPKTNRAILASNVYVLNVGISTYDASSGFSFKNCDDDAKRFTALVKRQHLMHAGDSSQLVIHELLNEAATYANIIQALNAIITEAKPNDYFLFNFSGFSWPLKDTLGKQEICFFPYVTYSITDWNSPQFNALTDKISLHQLRDLLEFIPAQHQLLITEAGLTPTFMKDFAKAMIETSPSIAQLSLRNRVLIVPEEFGKDYFSCNGKTIQGGPLMSFLENMCNAHQLFDLFAEDDKTRKRAVYSFQKEELQCDEFTLPYASFFFERDFVKDLQYYIGEDKMQSRSTAEGDEALPPFEMPDELGRQFALVIGTTDYTIGGYRKLPNAVEDAKSMKEILETTYGYTVEFLIDPHADTIIAALKRYSHTLQENDQFILFVAGHGEYDPLFFNDGFLITNSSLSRKADPYRRTSLPFSQLRNIIDNFRNKQILLLVDVCFGGAFDEKISSGDTRSDGENPYLDMPLRAVAFEKLELKTRIVLSSGSLNKVPDGYEGKHSPFAARILTCLQTKGGKDGYLTSIQLFSYVQKLPSKPLLGELRGNDGGGEYFLIPKLQH